MPTSQADHTTPIARPTVAAGVLFFDKNGQILVVQPTYKASWDIPGGYVEDHESPKAAATREVHEELGIDVEVHALLAIDYAPCEEGDKLLFVFDGGVVDPTEIPTVPYGHDELKCFEFCDVKELSSRMPERLASRIRAAIDNRARASHTYIEYGQVPKAILPARATHVVQTDQRTTQSAAGVHAGTAD